MNSPFPDEILRAVNFSGFPLNPQEVTVQGLWKALLTVWFGCNYNARFCILQVNPHEEKFYNIFVSDGNTGF